MNDMTYFGIRRVVLRKISALSERGFKADVIEFSNDKGERGQIDKYGRVTWHDTPDTLTKS